MSLHKCHRKSNQQIYSLSVPPNKMLLCGNLKHYLMQSRLLLFLASLVGDDLSFLLHI